MVILKIKNIHYLVTNKFTCIDLHKFPNNMVWSQTKVYVGQNIDSWFIEIIKMYHIIIMYVNKSNLSYWSIIDSTL